MPPEPNPFEPPRAATPPGRPAPLRSLLALGLVGLASAYASCEGLEELLFSIPFRHTYFRDQAHPNERAQAWMLLGVGVVGVVGSCGAFALRRREARRPAGDGPSSP